MSSRGPHIHRSPTATPERSAQRRGSTARLEARSETFLRSHCASSADHSRATYVCDQSSRWVDHRDGWTGTNFARIATSRCVDHRDAWTGTDADRHRCVAHASHAWTGTNFAKADFADTRAAAQRHREACNFWNVNLRPSTDDECSCHVRCGEWNQLGPRELVRVGRPTRKACAQHVSRGSRTDRGCSRAIANDQAAPSHGRRHFREAASRAAMLLRQSRDVVRSVAVHY